MSVYDAAFVDTELSKRTSIFGLRLWVVIGILVGSLIVIVLFLLSLCLTSRRRHHHHHHKTPLRRSAAAVSTPPISKEILEIVHVPMPPEAVNLPPPKAEPRAAAVLYSSGESRGTGSLCETASSLGSGSVGPEVSHLGWGRWYTLRELEAATNGLCEENVIGEGGYGIVYRGLLPDGNKVAVKNLLNNKGQAEREFKVEVEVIGRVRHKNLVRLLGYCVEGAYRMLVYEYVDNGNLEQWLHGDVGTVSPITWDIRMNIILGTAKGLAYLHEGLEPKVVHRDVKSSNILLDRQWNPKVSDFGLAKLLSADHSYVTTRVMGTFGYVAPEYACTGMLTEKSDVYSFGILIMEIITGRSPVDYSRPQGEVNLIEWLKSMVGNRKSEEVVDPKLAEKPSSRALKRVLLVALRCVDPDAAKRPKIGHVIHMLEAEDLLFRDERRTEGESSRSHRDYQLEHKGSGLDKRQTGGEINNQHNQIIKRKMLRIASSAKRLLRTPSFEAPPLGVRVLPRLYHERVVDHYDNPRNVGSFDKNDPAVGTGLVGAPACGDVMKLQIKVDEKTGKIVDARFKTFGCGSAIASSSVATEWVKGKQMEEVLSIKNTEIAKHLSLPPVKLHCSMLAEDAIKAAVKDYETKRASAIADGQGTTGEKAATA